MEVKTKIPIPVFGYTIFVTFTDSLVESANNLHKKGHLVKNHGIDDTTDGFTVRVPNQSFEYIILKPNSSINHLTHEIYHAIVNMFEWIGARHEDEIFAYFMGYITQLVSNDQKKAQKKFEKTLDKK